jgi:hypothetical protein
MRVAVDAKMQALKDTLTPGLLKGALDTPPTMPTVDELRAAGLGLDAITAADPDLNPGVLLRAGVVRTLNDCRMLGIAKFADFVTKVGAPHRVEKWMGEAAWLSGFVQAAAYDWNGWTRTAHLLKPIDLAAMRFHLGATLDAQPGLWKTAPLLTDSVLILGWLQKGNKAEWGRYGGLRGEQYDRLVELTQAPPPNPGSFPAAVVATPVAVSTKPTPRVVRKHPLPTVIEAPHPRVLQYVDSDDLLVAPQPYPPQDRWQQ